MFETIIRKRTLPVYVFLIPPFFLCLVIHLGYMAFDCMIHFLNLIAVICAMFHEFLWMIFIYVEV